MKIVAIHSFMQRDGNRPRLLVRVDTDDGISGWGEAYNHGPDRALVPVLEYLALQLSGHDPRRIEYLYQMLLQSSRFPPGAIGLAAISAIEQALWDVSAKALGVPVYMLLGGAMRDRVRVYCGLTIAPDARDAIAKMLELQANFGFTAFKLSPFRRDLHAGRWGLLCEEAGDYFAQLRRLGPPEFEIAFDAHAKIFEPYQAIQLGNALAPSDPLFFEEPIRPEHIPAWSRLRTQLQAPLATGECLYNRFEFLALLAAGGADIIQPDVCVVGGLLEMRRIAALAEAHFVSVAPHNPMGPLATAVNLHLAAAMPNFKILEYRLPADVPWAIDPYLPRDGHLDLRPDRPGWGLEIDMKMLAQDNYVHWERKLPIKPDGSTGYT